MNQLRPASTFTINRILKDHTDTATRYVQAVVYDADTRAVLATKNLTDNGDRWFSASYKVPYDNVFMRGRYILIVTTVYTDSGYTTKSDNYAQESEEYLVIEPFNNHAQFGGGVDVDYKEIRKILREEIKAELETLPKPEPIVFPKPPPVKEIDLTPHVREIVASVKTVEAKIDALPPPIVPDKPKAVDLTPVIKKIDAVMETVKALPRFKETDLTPMLEEVSALREVVEEAQIENATPKTFTLSASPAQEMKAKRQQYLKSLAAKHGF